MAAKLTRVSIRDYRSIGVCYVNLRPLTLLVGPNGSGKSNFLDALRFLVHSMHAPLEQVVEARFGMQSLLRKQPKGRRATTFSIEVSFAIEPSNFGMYSITVGEDGFGLPLIEREECHVGSEWFTATGGRTMQSVPTAPAFTGDRPALVAFGGLPQFAPAFNLLAGLTFYAPNPEQMRRAKPTGPGRLLSRDASNAADVLARLERTTPAIVARIKDYLRSFNPEFADVTVTENGSYRTLAFTPASNPSSWTLSGSEVSDGTLRAVGILLAIFQAGASPSPATLIGLEEPESNLHPAAAGVLLDALLEASSSVAILATTHSADMLDRKDLPDDSLLAVAMQDGETVIGPLNESSRAILRKHLYTAGELLRSNQFTPDPSTPHV